MQCHLCIWSFDGPMACMPASPHAAPAGHVEAGQRAHHAGKHVFTFTLIMA